MYRDGYYRYYCCVQYSELYDPYNDLYSTYKIHIIINCLPKPILPSLILPTYSLNSFYTPSTASIDTILLAVKSS